jgi:hypothetical protein
MVHSANFFTYINLAQADNSGMLRFLTDELQDAEDNGDRGVLVHRGLVMHLLTLFSLVWIVGHVPSGWDGIDALQTPSNLCEHHSIYQPIS